MKEVDREVIKLICSLDEDFNAHWGEIEVLYKLLGYEINVNFYSNKSFRIKFKNVRNEFYLDLDRGYQYRNRDWVDEKMIVKLQQFRTLNNGNIDILVDTPRMTNAPLILQELKKLL